MKKSVEQLPNGRPLTNGDSGYYLHRLNLILIYCPYFGIQYLSLERLLNNRNRVEKMEESQTFLLIKKQITCEPHHTLMIPNPRKEKSSFLIEANWKSKDMDWKQYLLIRSRFRTLNMPSIMLSYIFRWVRAQSQHSQSQTKHKTQLKSTTRMTSEFKAIVRTPLWSSKSMPLISLFLTAQNL